MATKGLILSVSRHLTVLQLRNAVLQQAGYSVLTTRDPGEAVALLNAHAVDAVVIGDSIPASERHALAKKLRSTRDVPLVMIYRHGEDSPLNGLANAYVGSLDPPDLLVSALQQLVPRRTA